MAKKKELNVLSEVNTLFGSKASPVLKKFIPDEDAAEVLIDIYNLDFKMEFVSICV